MKSFLNEIASYAMYLQFIINFSIFMNFPLFSLLYQGQAVLWRIPQSEPSDTSKCLVHDPKLGQLQRYMKNIVWQWNWAELLRRKTEEGEMCWYMLTWTDRWRGESEPACMWGWNHKVLLLVCLDRLLVSRAWLALWRLEVNLVSAAVLN